MRDVNNFPDRTDADYRTDADWEYKVDIFIKPGVPIKYVNLNFIAVKSGLSFDEIVGSLDNEKTG